MFVLCLIDCLNEISTFHKTDPRMYYCIQRCTKNPFIWRLGVGGQEGGLGHSPTFLLNIFFFIITKKVGKQRKYHFYFPDHATKGNYILCKRLKVYVIKLGFCMQVNTDFTVLSIRISLHCFIYFLMFSSHVFTKTHSFPLI